MRSSLGVLGAASASSLGCELGGVWGVQYEGIYTNSFTYRPGDTIDVFCSLRSGTLTPFEFVRIDVRPWTVAATVWANPANFGNPNPGPTNAAFLIAVSMPASELATGVYMVRIPPGLMREENRINIANGYPSDNSVAYFVVTPRVAGSSSRILWLHDSLTGAAYGSFGNQSIYPTATEGSTHMVSYWRPGLDRSTTWGHGVIPFLRLHGYEFEHIDLVDLATVSPDYLKSYDLVCCVGQLEYIPNEVIDRLVEFQSGGGNIFAATHEFGIFRVRLDHALHALTAYKWDYFNEDRYFSSGNPDLMPQVAGIGMSAPASAYETEVIGQTVWPPHRVSVGEFVSLPVYNVAEAGWILEGTGIGAGDAFPAAFNEFASGLCLEFDAGEPLPILADEMRLPEGLVVWGARPSDDGVDWRALPGRPIWEWPRLPSGHATATLQQRISGAQVVTLPSPIMAEWTVGRDNPIYDRLLLNIFARLSIRG